MSAANATAGGTEGDASSLAAALAPALREATGGRLGPIEWFSTAQQRGGAATGAADWFESGCESGSAPESTPIRAIVKLPVGPREHDWTSGLGQGLPAGERPRVPRVLACGSSLGGYDLAWLVIERLCGEPLPAELTKTDLLELVETVAAFQAAALRYKPVGTRPPTRDFAGLLHRSREALSHVAIPEAQRWNEALKHAQRVLPAAMQQWTLREVNAWCHGDVHPGNVLRRSDGGMVMIDLALVHAGHWVEDAVYLERQFWGRKAALHGVKPVQALARARKAFGLECGEGYAELADLRRLLMACCVPAMYTHEGSPSYARGALELLERLVPTVAKRSA